MRKKALGNVMTVAMVVAVMSAAMLTGCGSTEAVEETVIAEEQVAKDAEPTTENDNTVDTVATDEYFQRGVYASYAADAENPDKTYFYVFEGDGCGHIEDGATNSGAFFEYTQGDGVVKFLIGSREPVEDTFTVKSIENGKVLGCFVDTIDLIFEPVEGVDVDTFDATNYVAAANGEDFTYTDANGWSVKYDPEKFVITPGGPITTIVYTGEAAGTSMITVTYTIDDKAEGAIKAIGADYGDKAYYSNGPFPGAENVTGYWVTVVSEGGSGAYMTAMARDYMDGALIFQMDGHNGEDEAQNMEVSDALAAVIDSLQFPYEN